MRWAPSLLFPLQRTCPVLPCPALPALLSLAPSPFSSCPVRSVQPVSLSVLEFVRSFLPATIHPPVESECKCKPKPKSKPRPDKRPTTHLTLPRKQSRADRTRAEQSSARSPPPPIPPAVLNLTHLTSQHLYTYFTHASLSHPSHAHAHAHSPSSSSPFQYGTTALPCVVQPPSFNSTRPNLTDLDLQPPHYSVLDHHHIIHITSLHSTLLYTALPPINRLDSTFSLRP